MDDLVRWLGEQLDEDERIARDADPGPWKSESLGRHNQAAIKLAAPTSLIQFDGSRAAANGMHASRHDPARVLREIDAKRRMIDTFTRRYEASKASSTTTATGAHWVMLADTLRLLALPYADRPGYREEWRP